MLHLVRTHYACVWQSADPATERSVLSCPSQPIAPGTTFSCTLQAKAADGYATTFMSGTNAPFQEAVIQDTDNTVICSGWDNPAVYSASISCTCTPATRSATRTVTVRAVLKSDTLKSSSTTITLLGQPDSALEYAVDKLFAGEEPADTTVNTVAAISAGTGAAAVTVATVAASTGSNAAASAAAGGGTSAAAAGTGSAAGGGGGAAGGSAAAAAGRAQSGGGGGGGGGGGRSSHAGDGYENSSSTKNRSAGANAGQRFSDQVPPKQESKQKARKTKRKKKSDSSTAPTGEEDDDSDAEKDIQAMRGATDGTAGTQKSQADEKPQQLPSDHRWKVVCPAIRLCAVVFAAGSDCFSCFCTHTFETVCSVCSFVTSAFEVCCSVFSALFQC